MTTTHFFLIESDRTRHKLFLDGTRIATFPTHESAEAEANRIANRQAPGAALRFELDYKSTLNNLEIRGATLEAQNAAFRWRDKRPPGLSVAGRRCLC
jgi:hypothetical protein